VRGHPDPSFLSDLPLAHSAVEFAEDRHAGQRRRSDDAPFVVHPLEVASLLHRSGYPDRVVAAAVLHDVLEDTDVERSQLEELFGKEVSDLVADVSDDPAIPDEGERKEELRQRVWRSGGYAAAVYAAGASPEETAVKHERHRRSLEMLEDVMPGSRLTELLRFELETLETLPPHGQ
jgi:hypothetical protein